MRIEDSAPPLHRVTDVTVSSVANPQHPQLWVPWRKPAQRRAGLFELGGAALGPASLLGLERRLSGTITPARSSARSSSPQSAGLLGQLLRLGKRLRQRRLPGRQASQHFGQLVRCGAKHITRDHAAVRRRHRPAPIRNAPAGVVAAAGADMGDPPPVLTFC